MLAWEKRLKDLEKKDPKGKKKPPRKRPPLSVDKKKDMGRL